VHRQLAGAIQQQVERMRRQIDYHLAHARASASGADPTARCQLLTSAEALARTMQTIHADRELAIDVHVVAEHSVRGRREDVEEMLGNLVDNACKWAKRRVEIRSAVRNGSIVTTVDDDGPGLDPSLREGANERLAFGPQTWPHLLVRAMLAEQIYRALAILSGHPYHRARAR
jgi:23S rRNA pseudoU1915 N3-methylase RlmH